MAYKTHDATKRHLNEQWETAYNGYLLELHNMWELDAHYGFWVADEVGGVYCYGDNIFIDGNNLKYIVDNDISYSDYMEWLDYCTWAAEFGQNRPNLDAWCKGCPRVDVVTQEKMSAMKFELDKLIRETKEKF